MKRSSSYVLACVVLVPALAAARPVTGRASRQASDACWQSGKPEEIAKRPSPLDSASVTMDGGSVKVCYGRPKTQGRQIMGKLVPYNEPWRMGANEATTIHVPFRARIAGVNVEPGWYSLYAIPQEKQWQIVVNSQAQRWGIPIDAPVRAKDVGTGTVTAEHLSTPVESLTIGLKAKSPTAAAMDIAWSDTHVVVPIEKR